MAAVQYHRDFNFQIELFEANLATLYHCHFNLIIYIIFQLLMSQTDRLVEKREKTTDEIKQVRFKKQIELISQRYNPKIIEHADSSKQIQFVLNINQFQEILFIIHVPKDYPFEQPKYTFDPPEGFITKKDYQNKHLISDLLGGWSPGMKLSEIATKACEKIESSIVQEQQVNKSLLYSSTCEPNTFYIVLLFAVVVRLLIGLGGYSGENDPPNYGDFEAHRNWISLTYNRFIQNWYHENQTNIWWRLDYPPIAGYLSFLFAYPMKLIHPEGLVVQKGYQHATLKAFMRMTVVIADIIFFFIPVVLYYRSLKLNQRFARLILMMILLTPGYLLIDHGHFQYNCVMLGLVLYAYICLHYDRDYLACILFTIALSTKQMSAYYALAFLSILIGKALKKSRLLMESNFKFNIKLGESIQFFTLVFSYGWMVIITTIFIWLPWISYQTPQLIYQPLSAIFPIHRGLYQLKVSNFWCITDVIFKWQKMFSQQKLVLLCTILSILGSIPSMIVTALLPKPKFILMALFNISLTFYFFSYHVHEKSILVPLLFISINYKKYSYMVLDFIVVASFSMYHLLKQDNQIIQYFATSLTFLYFCSQMVILLNKIKYVDQQKILPKQCQVHIFYYFVNNFSVVMRNLYEKYFRYVFYVGMLALHVCEITITPPQHLPYLYHLSFAGLSFVFFTYIYVYSNLSMINDAYIKIKETRLKLTKQD